MKPSPDNLDPVVNLLALKRHEQPPPGYFDQFSNQVVSRIQAGEQAPPAPWWRRCLAALESRPMLVGAYSVAVCSLLLCGLSLAEMSREQALKAQWTLHEAELISMPPAIFAAKPAPRPFDRQLGVVSSSFTPVMEEELPLPFFEQRAGLKRIRFSNP